MAQNESNRWVMSEKPKILVVDDEISVGTMIVFLLTRGGCDADMARNADQALQLAQVREFDLITLDVELPDTTGFKIYHKLREIPHLKDTPICFVSGRPTIENIQRAFELGAADFIEKPFDGREFISRILFHARRERPASNFPDENPNPDTQSLCNTP
jgi:DNA-binding response OmpR family regulator